MTDDQLLHRLDDLQIKVETLTRNVDRLPTHEVIAEELSEQLGTLFEQFKFDDKYKDLPGRMSVVEREIAELKARLPPPKPIRKNTRRKTR